MRLLKRKARKVEGFGKLELERVIGLTTTSPSGLSCNPTTGELAYLAGAVVVIYNVKANSQTQFLVAPRTAKAFSCIAYSSQGGKFLAAGESGYQPGIIIWEVAVGARIAELRAHKQGVCCVQFSPNGKHLVSIGVPSDGQVCLWDWRSGTLLAKSRTSTTSQPACALQFASDGSFFVTGGVKHLKHWIIGLPKARSVGGNGTTGMEGKTVNLGTQKDSSFVAILSAPPSKDASTVTPDFQPLYALTAGGILCLLHCGLAIEKWVDLKVRHGYALAISEAHVGCACSDGIVRVFMHGSLTYAVTLPRPAPYGHHGLVDASVGASLAIENRTQPGIRFPDAVACSFLQEGQTLAVIYGDHSLLVWDVRSFSKIGRYRALLSHNACIWDVSLLPSPHQAPTLQPMNEKDCSPPGTFATCSADGSIRLWCLDSGQERSTTDLNVGVPQTARPVNIYNNEILGVLYIDKREDRKDKVFNGPLDEELLGSTQGFRSICVSPDGQHLAAGDRNGNLRVYDLNTLQLISFKEAHDGEILSLSFTSITNDRLIGEPTCIPLLASGGRDRLINIYDVNGNYNIIETLDDHTSLITTVKFACCGSKLLSCSADKSVIFRNVLASGGRCKFIRYHQELSPRGSFYDIDTDPSSKHAVAVGQDKKLSVLNLTSGKTVRHLKPEGDVGEPFKVRLDPSGTYVVCSHSDRIMRVYDFHNGELLIQASGHAEIITGVLFLPDCRRLVSVSGDSCIFIWRLPPNMSRCMRKRCIVNSQSRPPPRCLKSAPVQSSRYLDTTKSNPRRADQVITFDPLSVKSKNVCSADRKENSGQIKHTEATIVSVGQDSIQDAAERPHTESGESKKCYGCDGHRTVSEIRKESEHTLASSHVNSNKSELLDTNISDNSPELRSLQHEDTLLNTLQVIPRKEIHWKTVHTVFFSDNDYCHDELPSKAGHIHFGTCGEDLKNRGFNDSACSNTLNIPSTISDKNVAVKSEDSESKNLQIVPNSENEDGRLTHPSENYNNPETHKPAVILGKVKPSDELGERNERPRTSGGIKSGFKRLEVSTTEAQSLGVSNGFCQEALDHSAQFKHVDRTLDQDLRKDEQCVRISTEKWPRVHIDADPVKANTDDDFLSRRDFFSEHLPRLVSKMKVDDSDESCFSARFVARSTLSNFQSSWFDTLSPKADRKFSVPDNQDLQDDHLEYNPGRLLADERERLKLRERQDRMAIEVQRMRERLVNLGIAVAEIAHDSETTDGKWDSDKKYTDCCDYPMLSESPNKRSELATLMAGECGDSCIPNSSEFPEFDQCAKRTLTFCLQERIENGTENASVGGESETNCNGLSASGLNSLDPAASGILGTPRTSKIDRKIDLWQIKAREVADDGKLDSVGEAEAYLAANFTSVRQVENSVDEGLGVEHTPLICRPIKMPFKAEAGSFLANKDDKNIVERVVKSLGESPVNKIYDTFATSLKTELAEKKEYHKLDSPKDTISSKVALTSKFERERSTYITVQNLEEGSCIEPQELNERQRTNSETKTNYHSSTPPSNATFPSCEDVLPSARYFEALFLVRKEITNQQQRREMPGDKETLRKQKLFPKCNDANMNACHGGLTNLEVYEQFSYPSSGPLNEDHYFSTPPLPRPVEDYQKSLHDLMEAANKASLLFDEVRSICRGTTIIPSGTTRTPTNASSEILSVRRTYQKLLPGTLQTVQRLADEAAACGISSHTVVKSAEDETALNSCPNGLVDYDQCSSAAGTRAFQSRSVAGASTPFESIDVEGFISRYSETLASQVLALVHKALPDKQT